MSMGLTTTVEVYQGLKGANFCQLNFDYDTQGNLVVYKNLARTLMKASLG